MWEEIQEQREPGVGWLGVCHKNTRELELACSFVTTTFRGSEGGVVASFHRKLKCLLKANSTPRGFLESILYKRLISLWAQAPVVPDARQVLIVC